MLLNLPFMKGRQQLPDFLPLILFWKVLPSYFLKLFSWNFDLALWLLTTVELEVFHHSKSSDWVARINRDNQSTGIESLSAQLKAWRGGINRNWIFHAFLGRSCSAWAWAATLRSRQRCERSIEQSLEIESSRNFLCISSPRCSAWAWPACGDATQCIAGTLW